MRYALINETTGLVENIVEVEDGDGSTVGKGYTLFLGDAAIGDGWDGKEIIPQPQPIREIEPVIAVPVDPEKEQFKTQISALMDRLAALEAK